MVSLSGWQHPVLLGLADFVICHVRRLYWLQSPPSSRVLLVASSLVSFFGRLLPPLGISDAKSSTWDTGLNALRLTLWPRAVPILHSQWMGASLVETLQFIF
jgi:hypothetical protein